MKRNDIDKLSPQQLENCNKYKTDNPRLDLERIHEIASNPAYNGSEYVANVTNTSLKPSAALWKSSWFKTTV